MGESGDRGVVEELSELVIPPGAEADHGPAVRLEMSAQPAQDLHSGARCEERHHVARGHDDVERFGDAAGG
jgi:hypothetical protein